MKRTLSLAVAALAVSFLVTGCSDNEGSSTPAPVAEYNAIFVDAAVAGITWTCGDRSGVTDAEGHFGACEVGKPVSFTLGKMSLGTISDTSGFTDPKKTIITPKVLAEATGDSEVASKVAITLQSFDTDGDPTNGIQIDEATTALLEQLDAPVDLTSKEVTVAEIEVQAAETVQLIVAETGNDKMKPVTEEVAKAHLEETEKKIEAGEIVPPVQPEKPDTTGATGGN